MPVSTAADGRPFPAVDGPLLLSHLESLTLHRLGAAADAGLVQVSLPHPPAPPAVTGLGDAPCAVLPIGQWPGAEPGCPRRLLLTADAPDGAPATFRPRTAAAVPASGQPPTVEAVLFHQSPNPYFVWENHMLQIRHGDRRIGIALGLRVRDHVNWWQACRLIEESCTPFCRTITMAGAIPVETPTLDEMFSYTIYSNPYLHKHNWINGDLSVRLYANGVVEIYAHHVNARFFDGGAAFTNVVPVIGFISYPDGAAVPVTRDPVGPDGASLLGDWSGDITDLRLGDIRMDLTEVGCLSEPDWPGRWTQDAAIPGLTILRPYYGASLFGGIQAIDTTGGPWHAHPRQRVWPMGMARTLRFSLSLSQRSPRIARYLAPHWWYGACAEILPHPVLPVEDALSRRLDIAAAYCRDHIVPRGFESGSVPRHAGGKRDTPPDGRWEPGWDGDVPYAQFLLAYRSGDAADYTAAMRSAYHQTDVATDHSCKLVRMHGYPDGAYSIPMVRPLGTLAAYLETADPYLLNVGEAVTETAWRTHLNSWPRLAMGRDACFIRGAVFLYRYFANEHFRQIARQGCIHATQVQRPNGSYGDQGGGTGIHQWAGYITKPWMCCLGTSAVLDYLMVCPDEPAMDACIRRLGDWLLANRWQRDGIHGWSYQHDFLDRGKWVNKATNETQDLPTRGQWHDDHLARILGYCALVTGDPAYHQAYLDSVVTTSVGGGHGVAATGVHLAWLQHMRWRAQPASGGAVTTRPVPALAASLPDDAPILRTPTGDQPLS